MTTPTSPDQVAVPVRAQPDRAAVAAPITSGQSPEAQTTPGESKVTTAVEIVGDWIDYARNPIADVDRARADQIAKQAAAESINAQAQGTQAQEGNKALLDKLAQQQLPDRIKQIRYVERQLVEKGITDDGGRLDVLVGAVVASSSDVDSVVKDLGIPPERFATAVTAVIDEFKASDAYTKANPPIEPEELLLAAQRQVLAEHISDRSRSQYQIRSEMILESADPKDAVNKALGDEGAYDAFQEEVNRTIQELRDARARLDPADRMTTDAEFEDSLKSQQEIVLSTALENFDKKQEATEGLSIIDRTSIAWNIAFIRLQEAFPNIDSKSLIQLIQDQEHLSIQGLRMKKEIAAILSSEEGKTTEGLKGLLEQTEAAYDAKMQAEFAKTPGEIERRKLLERTRDIAIKEEPFTYYRLLKLGRQLARHKETLRIAQLPEDSDGYKEVSGKYTDMQKRIVEIDTQLQSLDPKSGEFKTLVNEKSGLNEQLEVWNEAQEMRGNEIKITAFEKNVVKREQSKYDGLQDKLLTALKSKGVQIPDDFIKELHDLPVNPRALGVSRKIFGELFGAWKKKRLGDMALIFKLLIGIIFSQGLDEMSSFTKAAA